jgi:hypothetical protein
LSFFHIHLWWRKNRSKPPLLDETVQKWREQYTQIQAIVAPDDSDRPGRQRKLPGAKDGAIDFTLAIAL